MIKNKKIKEEDNLTLEELLDDKTNDIISNAETNDLVSLIAISELTNIKKMKVISRIKYEQVPMLTKLDLFADTFGISFVKNLADNILQLQVSINGYGRKELVNVVNQSTNNISDIKNIKKEIFR